MSRYKSEARDAKKRVKVLTHQSALLMGELEVDERLGLLLGEVDALRDALEQQTARHKDQVEELQVRGEGEESEPPGATRLNGIPYTFNIMKIVRCVSM